jgi:hypothetical protein
MTFQTFRLLDEEGFFVGASSGLNISAAYQLAKQMGPGHTIATCLCDTGQVCCLYLYFFVKFTKADFLTQVSIFKLIGQLVV